MYFISSAEWFQDYQINQDEVQKRIENKLVFPQLLRVIPF